MKNFFRHFLICTVLSVAAIASAEGGVEILSVGIHHGDEVKVNPGPDWWGLFENEDELGYTLESAPVTITAARDEIVDDEGEATGKQVAIPQDRAPVFLVRGIAGLKKGAIEKAKFSSSPRSMLYPGQMVPFHLREGEEQSDFRLVALGDVKDTKDDVRDAVIVNYSLKLTNSEQPATKSQILFTIPELYEDAYPGVIWAGDLDRDGKPDLLVDASPHGTASHWMLFLSSAAKEGELVGRVAEWETFSGC